MANMKDVAKAAGVSKGTVSNVFSGKRPISETVRSKVLEAAEKLNYRPNYFARSMVTKQTRIIGLVMGSEKIKFSQYNISLVNGVLKECYRQGYRLLFDTMSDEFRSQVTQMTSDPSDGEIILDPMHVDSRIDERVANNRIMTLIGKPPGKYESKLSYVNNDNFQAAEHAATYLLSLGHRNILFINAVRKHTVSRDRTDGYRNGFDQYKLAADERLIVYRDAQVNSVQFGYRTAMRYLTDRTGPRITAVIADTDQVALGIYRAASELGIPIPEQLSVIAFNNDSVYPNEFRPPLTSIEMNGEMIGQEAAKLLIEQIQSKESVVKQVIIQSQLVERASCTQVRSER